MLNDDGESVAANNTISSTNNENLTTVTNNTTTSTSRRRVVFANSDNNRRRDGNDCDSGDDDGGEHNAKHVHFGQSAMNHHHQDESHHHRHQHHRVVEDNNNNIEQDDETENNQHHLTHNNSILLMERVKRLSVRKITKDNLVKYNRVYVSDKLHIKLRKQAYNERYSVESVRFPISTIEESVIYLLIGNGDNLGVYQCSLENTESRKPTDFNNSGKKHNFLKNNTSTIALSYFQRESLSVEENTNVNIVSSYLECMVEEKVFSDFSSFVFGNGTKVTVLERISFSITSNTLSTLLQQRNNEKVKITEETLREQFLNFVKKYLIGHVFKKDQRLGMEYMTKNGNSKKKKEMIEFIVSNLTFSKNDISMFGIITSHTLIDIELRPTVVSKNFLNKEIILKTQPVVNLSCQPLLFTNLAKYDCVFCSCELIESDKIMTENGPLLLYVRIMPSNIIYRVMLMKGVESGHILMGKHQRQNLLSCVNQTLRVKFFFMDPSNCLETSNDEMLKRVKEESNPFYSLAQELPYNDTHFRSLQTIVFKLDETNGNSISFTSLISYIYYFFQYHYFEIGQELAFSLEYSIIRMKVISINGIGVLSITKPIGGLLGKNTLCYFEKSRAFEYKAIPSLDLLELQQSAHIMKGSLISESDGNCYFVNTLCPEKRQPQCFEIERYEKAPSKINIVHHDQYPSKDIFKRVSNFNKSLQFTKLIRCTNHNSDSLVRHIVFNLDLCSIEVFDSFGEKMESTVEEGTVNEPSFNFHDSEFSKIMEWSKMFNCGKFKVCKFEELATHCATTFYRDDFVILHGGCDTQSTNEIQPQSTLLIYSIKDKKLIKLLDNPHNNNQQQQFIYPLDIYHHTANIYENDLLTLYGGLHYDSQQKKFSSLNNLIQLNLKTFEWKYIETKNEGPSLYYHTSTQAHDSLFICGGCHSSTRITEYPYLWELNLYTQFWRKIKTEEPSKEDVNVGCYCLSLLKFCPLMSQIIFLQMHREPKDEHYDTNYYKLSKLQKGSRHLKVRKITLRLEKSPLKAYSKWSVVFESTTLWIEKFTYQDVLFVSQQ